MRPAHIVTLLRIREFGGRGCSDFTLRLLDLNRWEPRTTAFGRPADLCSAGSGGGIFVFSSISCRIRQSSFV
jgi:hypothetical protein